MMEDNFDNKVNSLKKLFAIIKQPSFESRPDCNSIITNVQSNLASFFDISLSFEFFSSRIFL